MTLREDHRDLIALPRDHFDRLLACGGTLEGGEIANMRTYRLPANPVIHTRLLSERKTLCGKTWSPGGWQFTSRGSFGDRPPHGTFPGERYACAACNRSIIMRMTQEACRARTDVLRGRRP